jgi:hemolysin D
MREQIETRGSGSRALTIEALQQLENYVTTDAGDRGQLLETDAAVHSLTRKMEETVSQFIADQTQKLAEIERKRDRTEQELIKAQSKTDRTQLKSPIDGTVQQLSITTVGQVVTSGQSLLTVVPLEGPIEVEAMIANKDIGFVEPGQPAIVKIEAFPFTRYGAVDATVSKVSRDAVDERDATNLSDAATVTKPQPGASTAQQQSRTQNLVFPATLQLAQRSLLIDGKEVPLTPGMAVTVEIKTGSRRAIDFVLSPLREVTVQAGRER